MWGCTEHAFSGCGPLGVDARSLQLGRVDDSGTTPPLTVALTLQPVLRCSAYCHGGAEGPLQQYDSVSMAKTRTLRGLVHDTLEHAGGPTSYLHPHVWEYASQTGLSCVEINLLGQPPIATPHVPQPLLLASASLQEWFNKHVAAHGFTIGDVAVATVLFGAFGSHMWAWGVTATLQTARGAVFSRSRGWPPGSR